MTERYTIRGGQAVRADSAFDAWTSGDLDQMMRALDAATNPVRHRHFLLMNIVGATYRLRKDPFMAAECSRVAEMHLAEFQALAPALLAEFGVLPRVPTFQDYATLLTEWGDYDRAAWVCELAMYYGLHDGTKSDFPGETP